jgi:hypothetical protein
VTLLRVEDASRPADSLFDFLSTEERVVLNEESFKRMIAIERKRTERSRDTLRNAVVDA